WDATHLGRGWWSANIFYPHPLALAYSETLLPQAVSILPVYAVTRNPILCYNLVFLSTFVLSGLGMFLLARELTGRADAAFVAGLAFAFAPYRVASLPHLQVLSSAWMPFALYGFRRHFEGGRPRALAGGGGAWLLQNLSCGYYLLFFTPIVAAYLAWESITRHASARSIARVAITAAAVAMATLPFVWPYVELRQLGFPARPFAEVVRFSADTFAFFTADPHLHVWGSVARAWPKAEGALFPGLTIVVLAVAAAARGTSIAPAGQPLALLPFEILLLPLFNIHLPFVRTASAARTLIVAAGASAALLIARRGQRRAAIQWFASPVGFFAIVILFAAAMCLGPEVHARGRVVADGVPYAVAYRFVPGFDGVRVPARYAMIVAFGLASAAAFAIRTRRAAWVAGALILVESFAAPIPMNQNDTTYQHPGLAPLPAHVSVSEASGLYGFVAGLPDDAAIIELPLGEPAFDVRYMLASTRHWKRLVNGYSGGAPPDYQELDLALQDAPAHPDRAWRSLVATRATYVVVHEEFYAGGRGRAVTTWLRSHAAREVAAFGPDLVLVLP